MARITKASDPFACAWCCAARFMHRVCGALTSVVLQCELRISAIRSNIMSNTAHCPPKNVSTLFTLVSRAVLKLILLSEIGSLRRRIRGRPRGSMLDLAD